MKTKDYKRKELHEFTDGEIIGEYLKRGLFVAPEEPATDSLGALNYLFSVNETRSTPWKRKHQRGTKELVIDVHGSPVYVIATKDTIRTIQKEG